VGEWSGAQGGGEGVEICAEVEGLLGVLVVGFGVCGGQRELTAPARTGSVARTAARNKIEMIAGGDFGSARKTWWISG
jgi:hypothetical protein